MYSFNYNIKISLTLYIITIRNQILKLVHTLDE